MRRAELFGEPPEILGSGSARPEGTARQVEGGYVLNGRWNYLSGIDHSTALFLNCRLLDERNAPLRADDGSPQTRVAVVPVAAGTVLDTWDTLGMRGTASHDCEFAEAFAPAHHTYARGDAAYHSGPLYHPPQNAILISWTLAAANAVGMARGAMNAFRDLATGAGTTKLAHAAAGPGLCSGLPSGNARRCWTGRGLTRWTRVGGMWEAQAAGRSDLPARAVRARLAIAYAIRRSVDVVDRLFNVAGTNAIHRSVGLERFFRDLRVSGQHISGLPANYEYGGQALLGATLRSSLYT